MSFSIQNILSTMTAAGNGQAGQFSGGLSFQNVLPFLYNTNNKLITTTSATLPQNIHSLIMEPQQQISENITTFPITSNFLTQMALLDNYRMMHPFYSKF